MRHKTNKTTGRERRWLFVALLVVTAFIASPSLASAGTGTPTLLTDQPSYAPGDTVGLSGSGFVPGDTVTVSLADSVSGWTSAPVDEIVASDGSFSGAPIALPSIFSSSVTATATDTTTGDTASAPVMETSPVGIFTPTVTTDQTDYAAGSVVTITGSGWPAGDSLSVATAAGDNSWLQTDQVTTDASGSFTDQVTLPLMTIANYTVTASDASGLSATTTFTDSIQTSTAVTSSLNPSNSGQSVTFTATVKSGNPATNTVTQGQVKFGTGSNCTGSFTQLQAAQNVDSNGQVTYTTSTLPQGITTIRACYLGFGSGSTALQASDGTVAQTVNALTATAISAVSGSGTYGGTASLTATLKAGTAALNNKTVDFKLNGTSVGSATTNSSGVATLTGVSLSGYNAGTYTNYVSASFAGDSTYAASGPTPGDLTVAKASPGLSINLSSLSKTYGDSSFSVVGDVTSASNGTLHFSTGTGSVGCTMTDAGMVTITGAATGSNYCIISVSQDSTTNYTTGGPASSQFHIAKATLTVTPDAKSRTYGQAAPTYTFSVTGFQNSETKLTASGYSDPSCSSDYTPTTPVADSPRTISCTGGTADNYTFDETATAQLTISKAHLTVTADNQKITYGDSAPASSALTATISGFVNSQALATSGVSGSPSCSLNTPVPTNAGTYTNEIVCTINTLSAANYDFPSANFVAGTYTIDKATLTVTPDNKTITWPAADPTFTYTLTGFKYSETKSVIGDAAGELLPTCGTAAAGPHNAGSYTISCSGGSDNNYTFDYTATATLTVNAAVTSLLYTGDTVLTLATNGGTINPNYSSTLTPTACSTQGTISYTLTDSNNHVTPNTNVPEGVYTVTVTFTPNSNQNCTMSKDEATLTIGSPGSKATGGGFVTPSGIGRVNFGFVVDQVPGTGTDPTTNPAQYKGQFVLVKPNGWRIKGTFGQAVPGGTYVVTTKTTGKAGSGGGTGTVHVWDPGSSTFIPATNGGPLPFTISFADNGSGKKQTTPDTFGIHVSYDATANGYNTTLNPFPNFTPQPLKGGNITIS